MNAHEQHRVGITFVPETGKTDVVCNDCFMKIGEMSPLEEVLKPRRPADMEVLKCPKGHEGPFQIADLIPGVYQVSEVQNAEKTIVAQSGADMIYDSATDEHVECMFPCGPHKWSTCGERFLVPDGWAIDWR